MRGSFTEELVNNAIEWYLEENIAYFKKSHPPALIGSKNEDVPFGDKGDIDYYGSFRGRYVSFEVKETTKDSFLISRIRPHQLEILFLLSGLSAISFLLLNFVSHPDSCFLIPTEKLRDLVKCGRKNITLQEATTIGRRVPFEFPGILDFLRVL